MSTRTRAGVALAVLAAALCACGPMYVDLEEPRLCSTQSAAVLGMTSGQIQLPVGAGQNADPATAKLLLELEAATKTPGAEAELRFVSFGLENLTGIDPATIDSVKVTALPPSGSTLPAVDVLAYTRDPTKPAGMGIEATQTGGLTNLATYLDNGVIQVMLAAQASNTTAPWNADVRVCVYLRLRYSGGALGDVALAVK